MDFQNRAGSKPGSGGVGSSQDANADRRERLRRLALETIDIAKDPYFIKNHLGSYECRLCLTLHTNEGSYLAHTQGKKHQTNLAMRKAREAQDNFVKPDIKKVAPKKRTHTIGKPFSRVTKERDPSDGQNALLFEIEYPEIDPTLQPRHRFMSTYEQKVEEPDARFQFLIFAADPYENIAFKIPNVEIDQEDDKYYYHWDKDRKRYTLQIYFKNYDENEEDAQ